ncbi:unnamed protein product [Eretmochelys imbricata]
MAPGGEAGGGLGVTRHRPAALAHTPRPELLPSLGSAVRSWARCQASARLPEGPRVTHGGHWKTLLSVKLVKDHLDGFKAGSNF